MSMADIRLGDFWGKRYQDNEEGVSALLVMSELGELLLKNIVDNRQLKIQEQIPVDECLLNQSVHDYNYDNIHFKSIAKLRNSSSLRYDIFSYRRSLPIRYQIKVRLKEITAYIPNSIRAKLRRWYRKRV
jgi:hypothetical protein